MSAHVRRLESLVPSRAAAFGGKARGLAALARAGLPVPAGFAVSSELAEAHLEAALAPEERPDALLAGPAERRAEPLLASLRARVRAAPLAPRVEADLRAAFDALVAEGAGSVAVRSSSVREDDEARSAAGMHDTVLAVTSADALADAVRTVWSSALREHALAYLHAHGVRDRVGVGVVLQAMVPAEVAGVLFTANPLSGDPEELLVNASFGLGAPVVDGRVSPDTWRVDKATGFVRDHVPGEKHLEAVLDPAGGVRERPVDAARAGRPCLGPAVIARLAALGRRIEASAGGPRDVEWALANDTLYVLQARPITALPGGGAPRRARSHDRPRIVWSNVNVGEALPGVATPLTWSILSGFSERGFRRAFGALGCTVPRDAELVANFRGRIYLNLSEFLAIASAVPGLSAKAILSLGGGGELEALESGVEAQGRGAFFARLPWTAARFARENFRLTARVEAWERGFLADLRRLGAIDPRLLSATALHRVLLEVEQLLDGSGLVMLNVYGNLLATMLTLRALVKHAAGERADALLRALLTGLDDVDSAAPGRALAVLADVARADAPAREVLLGGDPRALRLESLPPGPTRAQLSEFLSRWGERGAREAEIAEPRWREDPTLLFAAVRLRLRDDGRGPSAATLERRAREVRAAATAELDAALSLVARPAARRLLSLAQHFLRLRERLRAHVVSVLGLYRVVALDASRRLAALEPACGEGAAFFLTIDEVHAFLRGETRALAPLVRTRRLQYARDAALPAPPDSFVGQPPPIEAPPDAAVLRGLGASGGCATGPARVLRSAADLTEVAPGEILVAAQADVGLSPLFAAAAGLVADLGGPLSHASVVARELGVPAVVNVKHGTRVIATGDRLELDGDAGVVRVLERATRREA